MYKFRVFVTAFVLFVLNNGLARSQEQQARAEPYSILTQFVASGYMGDTDNIKLFEAWKDVPYDTTDTDSSCVKISYTPASKGWAGIYWQNRANNWGNDPGEDFSVFRYTEITFWARGETGNEIVEFKAGDINDTTLAHRDSFRATAGRIKLSRQWKQYKISLLNKSLTSVIGGFCWVASGTANPRGLTFYLDNVQYVVK